MANILWNENFPRNADRVNTLSTRWPSIKTAVRTAMEQHFHWSDSTSSAGEPRLPVGVPSDTSPGGARFYYGARSAFSNPDRLGAAMIVSDESRLVFFISADSISIGGDQQIVAFQANDHGTGFDVRLNSKMVSFSRTAIVSQGLNRETFTAFATEGSETAPDVFLTPGASDTASAASYRMSITEVGFSSVSVDVDYIGPGSDPATARAFITSIGSVPV